MRAFLLLTLSLLLLSSCAPVRPNLGQPVDPAFAKSLLSEWQGTSERISSVQGLARVEIKAPMNDVKGTQVVIAERPGRLRAETLSPFGAPLLTLAVNDGQFGVLLPSDNVFYTGPATPETLGMFINIPLEPAELVGVLLYQPSFIKAWKEEAFTLTDGGWLLVRHGTTKRQELVFNSERDLVETAYFEKNDLKFKALYDQFDPQYEGFPTQIQLVLPEKYATIKLSFFDFETNGKIKAGIFELEPSPGVRIVHM